MSPIGLSPAGTGLTTPDPDSGVVGSGKATTHGVESIIVFRGLSMNQRWIPDTYMVNEIGGLDDAELRDDREVNPQAHGETAFQAFYGGRTITLGGYIRAFNLDKLRDMVQGLKQTLANIENESPLTFKRKNDPDRDVQIYVRKGAPLQLREIQTDHNYFRREFLITFRASNPRFMSTAETLSTAYFAVYEPFTNGETVATHYDSASAPTTFNGTLTPPGTARGWITRKLAANEVLDADVENVVEYATTDGLFTGVTIRVVGKWLDSSNFIYASVSATGQVIISKEDGGVNTTLVSGTTAPARSTGNYYLRMRIVDNVITAEHFTSDPRANDALTPNASATHTLVGANATKFGTGVIGRLGLDWTANVNTRMRGWSFGTYNAKTKSVMEITNIGNFPAQPEITFSNKMSAILLTNSANGDQLSVEADIEGDDSRTVDIANNTLKAGGGGSKFSELGIVSDWLEIEPDDNLLSMTALNMSVVKANSVFHIPGVSVKYKHTWF